jgi:hypothetical protein
MISHILLQKLLAIDHSCFKFNRLVLPIIASIIRYLDLFEFRLETEFGPVWAEYLLLMVLKLQSH